MASDRARVSHDPSRHWRGVISQQGRVTLEADWNEAGAITAAESRAELIDVVGPSGTPDDGYAIIPATDAGARRTATSRSSMERCTSAASGWCWRPTSTTPTRPT